MTVFSLLFINAIVSTRVLVKFKSITTTVSARERVSSTAVIIIFK